LVATPIDAEQKEKRFWFKVWNALGEAGLDVREFSDGDGFASSFSQPRADRKKVVLTWDEFDKYSTNVEVWADILEKIRALKAKIQAKQAPLLQGVIIVGSYRAGKIPPALNESPFNAHGGILPSALAFKPEETKELFRMAQDEWGMKVDDDVIQNIHDITAGHAGMINLCGRFITENLLELAGKHIAMEAWQTALVTEFFNEMGGRGAFTQFKGNAKHYEPPFKQRLALLAAAEQLVVTKATEDMDERIANEGFGDIRASRLSLKCELVKQLLLRQILLPPAITEPPLQQFDIIEMLRVTLKYFSPQSIQEAFRSSTKTAKTTYAKETSFYKAGAPVPKAAVYQFQLLFVFRTWCAPSPHIQITNEVDVHHEDQPKRSLDVLYENKVAQQKYAIELVASTTNADLDVHANRDYGPGLDATAEYIIHFTPVKVERDHMKFMAGTNGRAIPVIHVWHSADGREYRIIRSENEQEDITVNTADGVE